MSFIKLGSITEVDFLLCIYVQAQKYTGHRFSKLMYFLFNLRSILEVACLNLCIYVQTWKYRGSRFSILRYFFSISEVYLK